MEVVSEEAADAAADAAAEDGASEVAEEATGDFEDAGALDASEYVELLHEENLDESTGTTEAEAAAEAGFEDADAVTEALVDPEVGRPETSNVASTEASSEEPGAGSDETAEAEET